MNRLATETSPYLLQHADNPVDWYPWGEEAFERARALDRPLLLSVGYAACHWCHVMEHESFEDEQTAVLMNELFVCVKVDREERPDVDGLYMEAVVALTGGGGWPLTAFLLPDGRPFYGGTYYPPQPRQGMPSFQQVLRTIAGIYRSQRDELERQAETLVDAIRRSSELTPSNELLSSGLLSGALSALRGLFDPVNGGFGGAPKFPPASTVELFLRLHLRTGADEPRAMAQLTLDRMAAGGIYDQLGGGFHRYAVDAIWRVPHFEKMLYDNALLASAYLHGHLVTGEPRYRRIVEETLDYLLRELLLPEGGFASAQDADTDGVEGLTYLWTPDQLRETLPAEQAEQTIAFYGVSEAGDVEGQTVLHLPDPAAERDSALEQARAQLLAARARRPQPLRDDKALAAWNGLALTAFAEAGRFLDRQDYLEAARRLAEFLLGPLSDGDGRLHRVYREGAAKIEGYLEDYANVAGGLLELYWATGEHRWLEESSRLARLACQLFADPKRGGFYVSSVEGAQLVARRKQLDDHPTPSGNSMLATVLLRLARTYGDPELERTAVGVFRLARPLLERAPGAVAHLLCALDLHLSPPREIAVVGLGDGWSSDELARLALGRFDPNAVYAFSRGPDDPAAASVPLLQGKGPVNGRTAVYVCESFACRAPATTVRELEQALRPGLHGR